jgi:hypothetical protein
LASITTPSAARFGVGFQLQHFGLQQNRFNAVVEPMPVLAETSTAMTSPPIDSADEFVLQQLGFHRPNRRRLVHLVDGDDDRHAGRLGVLMASIVCGMTPSSAATTSTDDIGDFGAARAHGGERGVAGRVEEGDPLARSAATW